MTEHVLAVWTFFACLHPSPSPLPSAPIYPDQRVHLHRKNFVHSRAVFLAGVLVHVVSA